MFVKRVGKFFAALATDVGAEFTPLAPVVAGVDESADPQDVARVTKILGDMGYAETQVDAAGNISIRLTPEGVAHFATLIQEAE